MSLNFHHVSIAALRGARVAGIPIDPATITAMRGFLDRVSSEDRSRYSWSPGGETNEYATALGLLSRRSIEGWSPDNPAMKAGLKVLSGKVDPRRDWGNHDLAYLYFALGGSDWKDRWNPVMQEEALAKQTADGSWNQNPFSNAVSVILLEIYYRYPRDSYATLR